MVAWGRPRSPRPHIIDITSHDGDTSASGPDQTGPLPPSGPGSTRDPSVAGLREHTAVAGDTVSKMALTYLGSRAKVDAIIALNPSLKQNPHQVVIGKVYKIPAATPASATPTGVPDRRDHSANSGATTRPTSPPPSARPAGNEVAYTTKPGDSLWKIAIDQCGSGSVLPQIREMNKDVLKNGDSIRPNMKLRLPPRAVASAL